MAETFWVAQSFWVAETFLVAENGGGSGGANTFNI